MISTFCKVCEKIINYKEVTEVFSEVFKRVDIFGLESLTEAEQVVVEGLCCSEECFYNLQ